MSLQGIAKYNSLCSFSPFLPENGAFHQEYSIEMDVAANALLLVVVAYCFGFASNLDPPWLVLAYQGTPLVVLRALV